MNAVVSIQSPLIKPPPALNEAGSDRRGRRRANAGGELGRELGGRSGVVIDGRVRAQLTQESAGSGGLARVWRASSSSRTSVT